VFDGPGGQRTLELRVFDGVGGEAPTAMSTPPPAAPPQGRPRADEPTNGNRPVVVTTSSQPAPTEVEVPSQQDAAAAPEAEPEQPTARTSEDQVEAIRARIEARRARLREQAQQGQ